MPDQILGQWAKEFARLVGVAIDPLRAQMQAMGTRLALVERRLESIESILSGGGGNGGGSSDTLPSTARSELPTIPPPHSDTPL